jgi:hypothetical protein
MKISHRRSGKAGSGKMKMKNDLAEAQGSQRKMSRLDQLYLHQLKHAPSFKSSSVFLLSKER